MGGKHKPWPGMLRMVVASDDDRPTRKYIDVSDVPRVAGGLGALWSSARHLYRDSGLVRGGKALLAMNQPEGFDCPGCAWPEPADRSRFEFCENGAKAVAEEATTARATPEIFAAASVDELRLLSDFGLGQLGRITHPMVLEGRHYRPITWDRAIDLLAAELCAVGPAASALYTSGRTSNECGVPVHWSGGCSGPTTFSDCRTVHESMASRWGRRSGSARGTVVARGLPRTRR